MPNWTDYTKKQQPSDNDIMMIEDVDANVNKRLEFSGLADWIVEKLKKNNVISGALKFKGSSAYASLPTNPEQNDYYYSPDGNGTDGAGYYAWDGTAWIFIGNNDKGVDSTFTVEGAAADSKAVGDKFAKVDSETASLKEDLDNDSGGLIKVTSKNLFNHEKATNGVQYYASDLKIHVNDKMTTTDFIEIFPGEKLYFFNKNLAKFVADVAVQFDALKNPIENSGEEAISNITGKENASFIRLSALTAVSHSLFVTKFESPSTYEAYFNPYYKCVDIEVRKTATDYYNAVEYGLNESNDSATNFTALMNLCQIVSDKGGGVVYIPSGIYNIQNNQNKSYKFKNLKICGDGETSVLIRWNRYPIFKIVGESIKSNTGSHAENITLENLKISSNQTFTESMEAICYFECVSYMRINNCHFNGNGTHLDLREVFDSKIISTDFDNSGRKYKEKDVDIAKFNLENSTPLDLQGCAPTIILASSGAKSVGGILESTNQILFWGCRLESFTDGAIAIIGYGTNGIRFTDCKFESVLTTVPILMAIGTFTASSFCNCYFYRPTSLLGRVDGVNAKNIPMLVFMYETLTSAFSGNISMSDNSDSFVAIETSPIYINKIFSANELNFRFNRKNDNEHYYITDGVEFVEALSDISNNNIGIMMN